MVYQFRATIPESKIFFRVYEIKGETTLFKFTSFINDDLGFSPDQMVLYEGYDEHGELSSEYGMIDLGDGAMDTVTFDKVLKRGETELRYLFDMRNNRYIRLVLEGEAEFSPLRIYPCLVDEKGQNPDQFRPRSVTRRPPWRTMTSMTRILMTTMTTMTTMRMTTRSSTRRNCTTAMKARSSLRQPF